MRHSPWSALMRFLAYPVTLMVLLSACCCWVRLTKDRPAMAVLVMKLAATAMAMIAAITPAFLAWMRMWCVVSFGFVCVVVTACPSLGVFLVFDVLPAVNPFFGWPVVWWLVGG